MEVLGRAAAGLSTIKTDLISSKNAVHLYSYLIVSPKLLLDSA